MELKHYRHYCKDIENVENFEKAKKDNFKGWEVHHRLETHNSDGERREVNISRKELIALDMYYNRPAEELIFLTTKEHNALNKGKQAWNKGKSTSEKTRKKMSDAHKGKQLSAEHKKKIGEKSKGRRPMLGKHHSEESKKKMSEAQKGKHIGNTASKGMHWYNNGKENRFCFECPDGFVSGRIYNKK